MAPSPCCQGAEGGSGTWTLTCLLPEPARDGRGASHRTTLALDLASAAPAGTWTDERGKPGALAVRVADQAAIGRGHMVSMNSDGRISCGRERAAPMAWVARPGAAADVAGLSDRDAAGSVPD